MTENKLIALISIIGSALYNILYPHYLIFGLLIVCNIVDYVTAIIGAFERNEPITVKQSIKGIAKKLNHLFYVLVSLIIDIVINQYFKTDTSFTFISSGVIIWLMLHELISITVNISNFNNEDIPPLIKDFLERLKGNDGQR